MNATIVPVPSEIASAILDLREKYLDFEITKEEYDRRFQELQAEVSQDDFHPQVCLTVIES